MSRKPKAKLVKNIHVWTDLLLAYASIHVTAHPECATTALIKYMNTNRLVEGRTSHLG